MSIAGKHFAIIGAGIVGSALALWLSGQGAVVSIYERRRAQAFLKRPTIQKRNINLALSHRGLKSLNLLGLKDKIMPLCCPMFGRRIYPSADKAPFFQPYGLPHQAIYSVSRFDLNQMLHSALDKAKSIEMHYNNTLNTEENDLLEKLDAEFDGIFWCDGIHSSGRTLLERLGHVNTTVDRANYGYREVPLRGPVIKSKEAQALHIWPRDKSMLIALPQADGYYAGTLFAPFEGAGGLDSTTTQGDFQHSIQSTYLGKDSSFSLTDTPLANLPASWLKSVAVGPWNYGKHLLLGDAAHAILPFYGQGMNAGLEDVYVLSEIAADNKSPDEIFSAFYSRRKIDADAIKTLAERNYWNMKNGTVNDEQLLYKRFEQFLLTHFPNEFEGQYQRISFGDEPYHKALSNGDIIFAQCQAFLKDFDRPEDWSVPEAMAACKSLLSSFHAD
ncbi:MAG: FAD-dependent monooxygenase [Bacteroidetes bacterium]|nr:MAG: FAD-dependent monooxygenase [Bacteroidota bacterium]